MTSCQRELDLLWTKDSVLMRYRTKIARVNFMITSTKHYVLLVSHFINK